MASRQRRPGALLAAAVVATALTACGFSSMARADNTRCALRETAARTSGMPQPVLATLRAECPLLGDIVEEFVWQDLGEAFPGEPVGPRTREIAVVAAFAAAGDIASTRRHARLARAAGATALEFREMLYLTTMRAGVPAAIEATRALWDILVERQNQCPDRLAEAQRPQL